MLVGVISDIHGHLSEQAYDALQPCDMILCAGDVERPTVLMELDAIAPDGCGVGQLRFQPAGNEYSLCGVSPYWWGALLYDASP